VNPIEWFFSVSGCVRRRGDQFTLDHLSALRQNKHRSGIKRDSESIGPPLRNGTKAFLRRDQAASWSSHGALYRTLCRALRLRWSAASAEVTRQCKKDQASKSPRAPEGRPGPRPPAWAHAGCACSRPGPRRRWRRRARLRRRDSFVAGVPGRCRGRGKRPPVRDARSDQEHRSSGLSL